MKKLRVFAAVCILAIPSLEVLAQDLNQPSSNQPTAVSQSSQSAPVDVANQNKVFFKAIKKGDVATVKQICSENKVLINAEDKNGYTPLHNAAYYGQKQVVNELISQGANVNATDSKHGTTPLHSAASKKCNSDVVKALLDNGADQTKKDSYGKTPLEYASQCKGKFKAKKAKVVAQ
jgi:ankyrin repeat protein